MSVFQMSGTSAFAERGAALWALVPVKRLEEAKTRLASALSARQRKRLAEAMLRDVLCALGATPAVSGVIVVAGDPSIAGIACEFGAETIDDGEGGGINAAVQLGLRVLSERGVGAALVAPADIPLATPLALGRFIAEAMDSAVALVPAEADGGTNLLLVRPPNFFKPCFGPHSFARHVAAARGLGIEPHVAHAAGVGRDIDRPEDLDVLARSDASSHARRVLEQIRAEAAADRAAAARLPLPSFQS